MLTIDKNSGQLISAGQDGSLNLYNIEANDVELKGETQIQKIELKEIPQIENQEIIENGYSLQKEKIQAIEDMKMKEAEEYKKDLMIKLQKIREKY